MSFIENFLERFQKKSTEPQDNKTVEALLARIFSDHFEDFGYGGAQSQDSNTPPDTWGVEMISEKKRSDALNAYKEGYAVYLMDAKGRTGAVLIFKDKKEFNNEDPTLIEKKIPPGLGKLLFLEKTPGTNEYHLNFHFLLPMKFSAENRLGIMRESEGARLIRIKNNSEDFLLLAEAGLWEKIDKNYPRNPAMLKGIEYFVFGNTISEKNEEKSLSLGISRPEEFMAGRFFLPRQIARKPELILTRFENITASRDENFFKESQELWFRVRIEIAGKVYPFYYYFDKLKREDALNRKDMFRQMFRLILKKNLKHFKTCGLIIEKVGGEFDKPPLKGSLSSSLMMGFKLFSPATRLSGWVIVPDALVKLILHAILPPWAFHFLRDSLLNRLKMLLSLSRELQASGKMELYERPEKDKSSGGDIYGRLKELKLNFIKLNELLELITPREARLIIANLLYRRGWTGEKLRELFFFSLHTGYDVKGEPLYARQTLIGFDEERFKTFLMKNMSDQWESSEKTGGDYDRGMLEHFKILRLIKEEVDAQQYFTPTDSLRTVLEGEFSWYREEMKTILEEVISDKSYLKYAEHHIPDLNRLLTTMKFENLVTLFRYCPEDFSHFRGVVSENLYKQTLVSIAKTDIEMDEKAVETAIYYRRKIYEIINTEKPIGGE